MMQGSVPNLQQRRRATISGDKYFTSVGHIIPTRCRDYMHRSLSLSLSFSLSLFSLSLPLSISISLSHSLSLSFSHSLILSFSLSLFLSFSLSLSLSLSLSQGSFDSGTLGNGVLIPKVTRKSRINCNLETPLTLFSITSCISYFHFYMQFSII